MSMFFPSLPGMGASRSRLRSVAANVSGVAAAHAAILGALLTFVPAERLAELVQPLTVRLIELAPEAPPPPPPPPPPRQPLRPKPAPARIVAVDTPAPPAVEAPVFTVPTPPAPVAAPPAPSLAPAPPAPVVAVTPARFDAAYLNNPKPVYPGTSRRLGEEGRVLLRVHVGADGLATEVELKNSSGFPRLDAAAREAVAQWRFVPARRGDETVAAWVLVPIVFNLEG